MNRIPSESDLHAAYEALQFSEPNLANFALWSQWSRFDARLAEIWIGAIVRHWKTIHPVPFREQILKQRCPQVVGVLLEFAKVKIAQHAEQKDDVSLFSAWTATVLQGLQPVPWQQFFVGLQPLASRSMLASARLTSEEYRRWGFLGSDSLLPKSTRVQFSVDVRKRIRGELVSRQGRLTVTEYLHAVRGSVSRRQAERDLLSDPHLRAVGSTRARFFVKAPRRRVGVK